ncbi:hypothetical protein [Microbacterium sp. NPDC087665]|uniref:hypothetical protein n=1 Tax=Microbacterium sp. NPDC087665 TaxID=3364194 RepID=UPI0037FDC52B
MPMLLLALAATTMSGCAPEPQPSPTPTPAFASEEEAFAAAEEVYRAYNEAGNARIAGESTPDPQDYLIGEALEADMEGLRFLSEQGLRLTGEGVLAAFSGIDVMDAEGSVTITALVCLDGTAIHVLDAGGIDATPEGREEIVAQVVTFIGSQAEMQIAKESAAAAEQC